MATQSSGTAPTQPFGGGMLVGMGDGSVRSGPVPVPYPKIESAGSDSAASDGAYLLTAASHTARDTTYEGGPTDGVDGAFEFAAGGDPSAAHFNGFVSRFSAGAVDSGGGAHALYQDVVIPTAQISDGTSNTIMIGEIVAPRHDWDILNL